MSAITKTNAVLVKIQYFIMANLFILMILLMLAQVFFRYFLEIPLAWSEEVSRYVFIVVTYVGASIAIAESSHIEINVLEYILSKVISSSVLRQQIKNKIDFFKNIITLMISLLFSYYCLVYSIEDYKFDQISIALGIPLYFVSGSIFISMILISFHSLVNSALSFNKIYYKIKKVSMEC